MELHYTISENDYIAFNLHYVRSNPDLQKKILQTRVFTALICLIGGTVLMVGLKILNVWTIAAYVLLAAGFFFASPKIMEHNVKKNVRRILRNARNKHICGEKTMLLDEKTLRLTGEEEDTSYALSSIVSVSQDDSHFFISMEDKSTLIVPFSGFESESQQVEFCSLLQKES